MYNKYNITKEQLEKLLLQNLTNRQIAEIIGCGHTNVGYFIKKFGLTELQQNYKRQPYKINKIDSKFKAYFLGFVCCDAAINQTNSIELSVELGDKEILDYFSGEIDCVVNIDKTYDKKTKRFPRARLTKKVTDITAFVGGPLKEKRHLPITNKELIKYVLLGAFDADGCLTWGRRKDKNRLWQKVSFTSSLNICLTIQQILLKELNISTRIYPKKDSKCFVIDFSNKNDVLKFLDYIYCDNFIVLNRKYLKAKALRLELEENGEGRNSE